MSRNILITGATGKTGAYTVNALLRHGKSRLTPREPRGSPLVHELARQLRQPLGIRRCDHDFAQLVHDGSTLPRSSLNRAMTASASSWVLPIDPHLVMILPS